MPKRQLDKQCLAGTGMSHGYVPRVVPMILLQMPFEAWVNVPYILLAMCFTAWVVPYNSVSKMLYSMGSPLRFC